MSDLEIRGVTLPATGLPPDDPDSLIARLTASWLKRYASEHTRTAYRRDLGYWLGWCQAHDLHPLQVRMADVDDWMTDQREVGVRGDGHPAARRSIARRLSVISSWYEYLIRNTANDPVPLMTYNPAATDARPDIDKDHSPTLAISRAEADRLIEAADADGLRSSAIIRFMLTNAARCGVITTMQIRQLGHDRGHRIVDMIIKGGHTKRDPLPPSTAAAIDDYLASRGNPSEGLVFVTAPGGPVDESYLFRLVQRLAHRAGLDDAGRLSPHSLRRTAITEALEATDLRRAQDLAGHADPRTTRLYDDRRNELDGHAAYELAGLYGVRRTAASSRVN